MRSSPSTALALLGAFIGACSSTDTEVAHTGDPTGAPPASSSNRPGFDASVYGDGAPWEDPSRVSLTGSIRNLGRARGFTELVTGPDPPPIPGMTVCLHGFDTPCVETEATGEYTLRGLPKRSNLTITFEKEGYVPIAMPWTTGDQDAILTFSQFIPRVTDFGSRIPEGWDRSKSVIQALAFKTDFLNLQDGVTIRSTPEAEPTYYRNLVEPSQQESTVSGPVRFWNVEPRDHYDLTFEHPTLYCEVAGLYGDGRFRIQGYQTEDAGNVVRVPALEGFMTANAGAYCAYPKEPDASP